MKSKIKIFVTILISAVIFIAFYNLNNIFASTQASNTKTIEDGIYTIKTAINEKFVFDIYKGSQDNSANLELWTNTTSDNQLFNIKYLGDGYYTISALHSGKVLDVAGASTKIGANVLQYNNTGKDNQKWIIKDVGDGYYNIISKCNGLYLDIPAGKAENGANVQVWRGNSATNQKFKLEKHENNANQDDKEEQGNEKTESGKSTATKTVADGVYTVKTAINEKFVFDIYKGSQDNSANLELWTNTTSDNQLFNIKYLGDGYYTISALHSGKVLDVAGASTKIGANVLQYNNTGKDNQKWIIKDVGDGYYNIISKCNGLYLDIPAGKAENGANVQVWRGNSATNQKFKLEKQPIAIGGTQTISNGIYSIKCVANNKVLDVEGASIKNCGNILTWTSSSKANQKFYVYYLGNGYYSLVSINSGKYVDVEGASTKSGANVLQYNYTGHNNQQWIIKDAGGGYYNIISKCSGLYMTKDSSENVCVKTSDNSNNQKFKFEKANNLPSIDTSKYPGYKEKIQSLMSKHPNWNFELLYTGKKFDEVIAGETSLHSRNLVPSSYSGEWICPSCGTKLYDSGWYCASEKATAYYMDPRNLLDETKVFQFQNVNLYIEGMCPLSGIKTQVNGTFLQNYSNDIYNACRNKGVNAYYIIARLLQEQGRNGTTIGKGMSGGDGKTYYNPFNIGASGNGTSQIQANALKTAKQYGWNTMQKALEGGIDFCKDNWLENYQNTLYQNKFDIDDRNGTNLYEHQYMQNLMAACSEASLLKGMYSDMNSYFTFIIPVYEKMSSTVSQEPKMSSETYPMDVEVTASALQLREKASESSKILKTISKGTKVLSVQRGINSNWQKVILKDGTIGYMSGTYLKQVSDVKNCNYSAKVKTNDGSGCYVRIGPSTNLDKITALPEGTKVTVIDDQTYKKIDGYDWYRIILSDGRQAFMPGKYLKKV